MKKVLNVAIGGKGFVIEDDAYSKLRSYLEKFRSSVKMGYQSREVMEDLECRIAELFSEKISAYKDVISLDLVNSVISQLGMPDGEPFVDDDSSKEEQKGFNYSTETYPGKPVKKLFRNPFDKSLGGVCSGLATYINADVTLIRVIFIFCLLLGSAGFWVYIILWIVVPLAKTAIDKCQMFGLPVTAENITKFNMTEVK